MVSAAAGATGSVAGQIAKIAGARVVGIAGGPEKCRAVVEDFGFDACIDYRDGDLAAALKQHCPQRGRRLLRQRRRADPRRRARPAGRQGPGRAVRRHLQLPHRRAPRPGQLREPPGQDRDHAGLQRARRVGPLRRGLRRAARLGAAGPAGPPRDRLRRASSRASTPSTGCSPAPTSARCWSRSPTRRRRVRGSVAVDAAAGGRERHEAHRAGQDRLGLAGDLAGAGAARLELGGQGRAAAVLGNVGGAEELVSTRAAPRRRGGRRPPAGRRWRPARCRSTRRRRCRRC